MKTQQTRTAANPAPHEARAGTRVDESVLRALEADARLLVAFPWAKYLTQEQRERFADELAHHPTDMTNGAIESLLVTWRARAEATRTLTHSLGERRRAA
ncbi:MAG: hypothetical protein ABI310_08565 [Microbacteriaceae bacterium]